MAAAANLNFRVELAKMAGALRTHFSRDEVLEHDIYNPAPTAILESFERRALSLLLQDSPENEDRKRLFVDAGVQHLQMLYKLLPERRVEIGNKRAEATLMPRKASVAHIMWKPVGIFPTKFLA